jgi:HD superfamily phosphohydrolase
VKQSILSCLETGYTEPIRDILWGHIYLTPGMAALTKSGPFMRLHRIVQLGPAFYVYPGATHTRASHSIGVYNLARRLLICLVKPGADKWLTQEGVYSFLCAALLHDLGHFPYTHSLKELPLESHEALTAKIICSEPVRSLVAKAGGDPALTAAIIDSKKASKNELAFYQRLLSGTLDPDKLDYLNRDARCCGISYGVQDVDFILSCLCPHPERGTDIYEKGIPSVESMLFSKYLMYRTVYWHKQVRSATAMIKKTILNALENRMLAPEELYNLDDQGFFSLIESKNIENKRPAFLQLVRDGQFYVPVAEFPFDEKLNKTALSIKNRLNLEKDLAKALSEGPLKKKILPEKLIIDVPEPVSFESDLYIVDEECCFSNSSSAFKNEMVKALKNSLQKIRVFVEPGLVQEQKNLSSINKKILHITEKWLQ